MGIGAYAEKIVARMRRTRPSRDVFDAASVPGTIFSGAAGTALFCVEAARLRGGDEALVERADGWLEVAKLWAKTATREQWTGLPRGLVNGAAGIAYVDGLVGIATRDAARARDAADGIARAGERFDDVHWGRIRASGLMAGEAGVLVAAHNLLARLPADDRGSDDARVSLARERDRARSSLLSLHRRPLETKPDTLLGMGHGVGGELFALVTTGASDGAVRDRLGDLASLKQTDANGYTLWLAATGAEDLALVESWCNGMAGHTLLWSEVARRTGSERAMRLAAESARTTAFLSGGGANLCCGLTGQSIALQRFADVSGNRRYARLAYARLARAVELAQARDIRTFQLWRGELGLALAVLGRLAGEPSFPAIEAPRRRD